MEGFSLQQDVLHKAQRFAGVSRYDRRLVFHGNVDIRKDRKAVSRMLDTRPMIRIGTVVNWKRPESIARPEIIIELPRSVYPSCRLRFASGHKRLVALACANNSSKVLRRSLPHGHGCNLYLGHSTKKI